MRIIKSSDILQVVVDALLEINEVIEPSLLAILKEAIDTEKSALAKQTLETIVLNSEVAQTKHRPLCQDTGTAIFICEVGYEVGFEQDLEITLNDAVKIAYETGYLRKSMVDDPILRVNTKDNTPAIIHYHLVPGDNFKIKIASKGGGAENMSALKMLKPSDGVDGIIDFVLETIFNASGNPCPPLIVGIGIGGNFETCALMAKEALFRPLNDQSPLEHIAKLESDLLQKINELGVGPMGFGGNTTALAVKINTSGCHFASLPVAVNLNCHSSREKVVEL